MQIKYITVNEKEYPIIINFEALMETEEKTGKSMQEFNSFKLKDYLVLFHEALKAGAAEKNETYKADINHSKKLLNDCYGDFVGLVPFFIEQLLGTQKKAKE